MSGKQFIIQYIIKALQIVLDDAQAAAKRAHDTATDKESIARSKYETFGLEASYLAHGQSVRVEQCKSDILQFKALANSESERQQQQSPHLEVIDIGCLIKLMDEDEHIKWFYIAPSAGGLKVVLDDKTQVAVKRYFKAPISQFMLVTPSSPLGSALIGKQQDDEVSLSINAVNHYYEIMAVY